MFKPLNNQARRLWAIFGTVRKWFSELTKSTERKLQRQEEELNFEEGKLRKEGARVYVYGELDKKRKQLEQQKRIGVCAESSFFLSCVYFKEINKYKTNINVSYSTKN